MPLRDQYNFSGRIFPEYVGATVPPCFFLVSFILLPWPRLPILPVLWKFPTVALRSLPNVRLGPGGEVTCVIPQSKVFFLVYFLFVF